MTEKPSSLHTEVDQEIIRAATGADRVGDDEPGRAVYQTRLRSLHDAVVAVEDGTARHGD